MKNHFHKFQRIASAKHAAIELCYDNQYIFDTMPTKEISVFTMQNYLLQKKKKKPE